MKNAYVIGHITIKDSEKWDQYRNAVPATLEPWRAELVLRGKLASVFSGEHSHTDTVVIQFPDKQSAENWHSSTAYQSLIPLRKMAAEVDLNCFEQ